MKGHPPTVKILVVLQTVTAVAAVVALIVSLSSISGTVDNLTVQRQHSRYDICQILQKLVTAATPPNRAAESEQFLGTVGLRDCHKFARRT